MVAEAPATLEFFSEFARPEAVRGLERFSHIWVLFVFHKALTEKRPLMVRPPRLGGNRKVGVFSSRSPFRPNAIGQSAVRLEKISITEGQPILHLKGVDILDRTPVLDIKPYLPYADIIETATGGFAAEAPQPRFFVAFTAEAENACRRMQETCPHIERIIVQMLENDPRPAYRSNKDCYEGRIFGTRLFDFDLKWTVSGSTITVLGLGEDKRKKAS